MSSNKIMKEYAEAKGKGLTPEQISLAAKESAERSKRAVEREAKAGDMAKVLYYAQQADYWTELAEYADIQKKMKS